VALPQGEAVAGTQPARLCDQHHERQRHPGRGEDHVEGQRQIHLWAGGGEDVHAGLGS
jgi:hypothetical protein